ncbi:hypothetical protein LO772_29580 [Yinghuangia sp. ASG 101]|uniref:hypothetical protein n=1 Tax=Yinghuangia sp. ASG 101 TaxID=2896848 RepID=UPI001E3A1AAB|nr:hypothetical protein [Yinghuangia sp. ASG 101]UGQ10923.1 hypothetical protein LO772_29580 [Yinghuangia sp. ASG 101]
MPEYTHRHYHRDPLHIADALDQIRRRLKEHRIEAPPGVTAFPAAPSAFDLAFITSRLAELIAQIADEAQVRAGFQGHTEPGQHTTAILTHTAAETTDALHYLSTALALAGTHYSAQDNPRSGDQPPRDLHEQIHRNLARTHRVLVEASNRLRQTVADHGYTYPRPIKRVRGITPVGAKKPPPAASATASRSARLL